MSSALDTTFLFQLIIMCATSGGGRRPALTRAVVFVFAQLPQAFNQSKQKIEQPQRGADGQQVE